MRDEIILAIVKEICGAGVGIAFIGGALYLFSKIWEGKK